jgi:hypothetical protein
MKRMVPPLARIAASTLSTMNGMSPEKTSMTSGCPRSMGGMRLT